MRWPLHTGRGGNSEHGYAIPELLVAAMLGLIVAATAGVLVTVLVRTQPQVSERAGQIQQGRTMVEALTRELRQGESVVASSASGLELLTYVSTASCGSGASGSARLCRVSYACGSQACTRTERNADGSGVTSVRTVVGGIVGPNVFTFTDPNFVEIQLVFPRDGGAEAVTVEDGVALRNYFDSSGAA